METLVLCPEELCLGASSHNPSSFAISPPCDFSVWTNSELDKGTKFLPWKGTVRSDKLPVFDKLPEFDIRNRFGLYDEISEVAIGRRIRQCNWIRFLRYTIVYNEDVNVIGFKGPTGEPIFELIKDIGPKTELIAFFVPEQPQEAFLLPAIQYLRHTLFKRLIDNVLEESPLDLSNSLVSNLKPPTTPEPDAERKSVSGESTASMDSEAVVAASPLIHEAAVPPLLNFHRNLFPTSVLHRSLSMASEPKHIPAEVKPPIDVKKNDSNNNDEASPVHRDSPIHTNSSLTFPAPKSATTTRRREKNMLPCNYCGKAFDRPSLLKRHIRIHTGERPHVCDYCNKGFSTSSSLNTHRRIHSGEKPHQCGVCGKRFTASSNLYYHRMTHVKEKPHKCTMCSKSFPTPGDLKSHMYVHTGTWPFKCHICQRGFSKQTNLKNHLLLHSGDKPFSCEICHKKFALSCNLRSHIKTHESEFQSSAASIALYQRALAMLGSPGTETEDTKSESGSPKALFGNQVTIKV